MSLKFHAEIAHSKNKDFLKFKKLYKSAFPWEQRIPVFILSKFGKRKNFDFLLLFDESEFIGFTFLFSHKDLTHVLYLAIKKELRSCGYGSKALNLIKTLNSSKRIFLNIDDTGNLKSEKEAFKIRRKNFYLKNGFQISKIKVLTYKNISETLVFGGDLNSEEVKQTFGKICNRFCLWLLGIKVV